MILIEERSRLEKLLQPSDTGHIHTAISVLDERIVELKESVDANLHS